LSTTEENNPKRQAETPLFQEGTAANGISTIQSHIQTSGVRLMIFSIFLSAA
jgi:hypothetical protein